ncbi:MAG: GTP-binding protein, partial [Fuerstiella sp.]|nr:GTP-binding protein [Fuerstiella sp.]
MSIATPTEIMPENVTRRDDIRNIAIIAHVDHGKTSLVDCLIKHSGMFRDNQKMQEFMLDSNDLERERGITILAKNIAMMYQDIRINIIDTPGHADFGGEVERVLKMADGALLLVDAFEGPRPQTRFVLQKALENNLKLMVVINKIDRPDCRPDEVLSQTFDLLVELGADDETLDFPYIFTSAKEGYAVHDATKREGDIRPLLDMVLEKIPGPVVRPDDPLQLMVTSLEWSKYVGRIATGRIAAGQLRTGQQIALTKKDGTVVKQKVDQVQLFSNLGRSDAEEAS